MSFNYIVISDVHFGHRNTPTAHIIDNFKKHILILANSKVNVIFINGDLFDRLLDLNSPDVHEILDFFNYLLNYCVSLDISLRVLEGTPSHDNFQSELLYKINQMRTKPCDLVYHKRLTIEHIEKYNKYVLYIPDEWVDNQTTLYNQINEQLNQHNIRQVDMCMLHGQFNYQVAGIPFKGFVYDESYFLSLCKGYIHIGHHHNYTTFDRIIANGSFDRLVHGEEDPKGYILVEDNQYCFVENPTAFIYKTILVRKNTTIQRLDKLIANLPKGSHVRLVFQKDHELSTIFNELKVRYLDYQLKRKLVNTESELQLTTYILPEDDITLSESYVVMNDVYTTVRDLLTSNHVFNESTLNKLNGYLEPLKQLSIGESTHVN